MSAPTCCPTRCAAARSAPTRPTRPRSPISGTSRRSSPTSPGAPVLRRFRWTERLPPSDPIGRPLGPDMELLKRRFRAFAGIAADGGNRIESGLARLGLGGRRWDVACDRGDQRRDASPRGRQGGSGRAMGRFARRRRPISCDEPGGAADLCAAGHAVRRHASISGDHRPGRRRAFRRQCATQSWRHGDWAGW